MMAFDSKNILAWFIACDLLCSCVLQAKKTRFPVKALLRHRRQSCADGTYEHEGMTCCLCGAGLKLESHCLRSRDDRQCSPCEHGKYSSQPNFQPQCDPCTSCEHPNANLEVEEPCTPARDTKCRCKKNHFCSSGTETCRICYPCRECGDEGVKVPCTAKNNTVCNDKIEGGNTGTIIAIIVPILLIALLALIGVWYWRKRKSQGKTLVHQQNNVELQPLKVSDIQPHLPDIAEELGWKDMKDIAIRCGIPPATIESCVLNHPGDAREATFELLRIWVEREGSGAGPKLIQILQNSNRKHKAEMVTDILRIDCAA